MQRKVKWLPYGGTLGTPFLSFFVAVCGVMAWQTMETWSSMGAWGKVFPIAFVMTGVILLVQLVGELRLWHMVGKE